MRTHELGRARKGSAFTDDYFFDAELHHGACAKVTRHKSRVENRPVKATDPSGSTKAVDFSMGNRIVFLDALVMADGE